jgi:prepilin-type processing-associated H-X9-DG protein
LFVDHTVEIQFLDGVLKKNGVCDILKAMAKVDTSKTVSSQLGGMASVVNGKGNLLFLDGGVNNRVSSLPAP